MIRNGHVTFGCFNNPTKLTDAMIGTWRKVLDASPVIRADALSAREMAEEVDRYRRLLDKGFGEQLPQPFVLQDVLDLAGSER